MNFRTLTLATVASLSLLTACGGGSANQPSPPVTHRTIVMVWDGLRPDSINATDTPNLYALQQAGVNFTDNHSTYPTFTMMNGSSFATGAFPKTSGFYGNTFWTPPQGTGNTVPVGPTAANNTQGAQDYVDPVFTEDYAVLDTLNAYYGNQLLLVKSLFATAQSAGLKTATIGKSGAAYIQDLGRGGIFLDENTARPASFVTALQAAGVALPANITKDIAYNPAITLTTTNGNPTARAGYLTFPVSNYGTPVACTNAPAANSGGATCLQSRDATDATQGAPEDAANKYMMTVFINNVLPATPDLSLIWFRTPDNPQHGYGVNTANAKAGMASQDRRLGELQAALKKYGLDTTTDIVIVSDHAHSTVSGDTALYPLRTITPATAAPAGGFTNAAVGGVDAINGFSFSGDVRSADILSIRGFNAYDGSGCIASAMAGIKADGTPVQPLLVDTGLNVCVNRFGAAPAAGSNPANYMAVGTGKTFFVPAPGSLPTNGIVIAANGGSDYFYLPSHDLTTLKNLVTVLQQREEFGAVFVDSRYYTLNGGPIPGTLPLSMINLENALRLNNGQPDVVVSFSWNATQVVRGLPGTEYESFGGQRGMHGSFSPIDVHNTLIAAGPSFKSGFVNTLPTGNVDVAPTVAATLGLAMPAADGRVLGEALANPPAGTVPSGSSAVAASVVTPAAPATGLMFELPTDLTGTTKDTAKTVGSYSINLNVKDLTVGGKTYRYFDSAAAVRQ